jgi:hypothetical protein
MGLKLLLVCGLALLMTIPSIFVNSIVEDRTKRAKDVIEEISGRAVSRHFSGPHCRFLTAFRRSIKALRPLLAFMWCFRQRAMPA